MEVGAGCRYAERPNGARLRCPAGGLPCQHRVHYAEGGDLAGDGAIRIAHDCPVIAGIVAQDIADRQCRSASTGHQGAILQWQTVFEPLVIDRVPSRRQEAERGQGGRVVRATLRLGGDHRPAQR